jgi:hypothetical protein
VGIYLVPGHAGVRGNGTADELVRSGSASGFVGPGRHWGSLGRTLGIRLVAGWGAGTGGVRRTSVKPNDRVGS